MGYSSLQRNQAFDVYGMEIMTTESGGAAASDPLKAVADAMDAAVKAAKDGAEDARVSAASALPVANQFLSKIVYKSCYGISYGLVFPTVLLARSIPVNNAAVHGFIDGAHAALDMVAEMRPLPAVEPPQVLADQPEPGPASS
jgi:hypothetical protein